MRILSNAEIARALEKQKMYKGKDLSHAICEGDRLIAQAQAELTLKEVGEWLKEMMEHGHLNRTTVLMLEEYLLRGEMPE